MWCLKNNKDISSCKSFQIGWDLANSLVNPFIENRCINGLPNQVIQKIENVLEKKVKAAPEISGKIKAFPYPYRDERRQCKNCEKGSSKAKKSNLPKTKEHCEPCGISVCRDHSVRMCNDCVNKIWNILFILFLLDYGKDTIFLYGLYLDAVSFFPVV